MTKQEVFGIETILDIGNGIWDFGFTTQNQLAEISNLKLEGISFQIDLPNHRKNEIDHQSDQDYGNHI